MLVGRVLVGLALAGCGDGSPSEADMRMAVEAGTRRAMNRQGVGGFQGFESFRKQGCVDAKDRPRAFDCYYAAAIPPQPGRSSLTVNGKGRFTRSDKGLVFEDLGAQPR
jgi:hypothetical protein